mgnify:CR=1 FL=1
MTENEITDHLQAVAERLTRDGMAARVPRPEETMALHLAVAILWAERARG